MRRGHIDFVRTKGQPAIGWLLLLLGALAAAGASAHFVQRRQQLDVLKQAAAQQARQLEALQKQIEVAPQPSTQPYVDDKRWQRAAKELSLPWMDTLQAIEQASKPPVFLVGLKATPATGRFQLDGEAPSLNGALAYVASLQTAKALTQTQLLSHDEATNAQGFPSVRFALQTQWVVAP